jgi:hypothetical protein
LFGAYALWAKYSRPSGGARELDKNFEKISQMNFHCGHIVSEINNGTLTPENLKPICQSCNSSIGTKNMDNFIKEHKIHTSRCVQVQV